MQKLATKLIGGYLNSMAVVSPKTAGRQGFKLFCYPTRPPLKHYHLEFLNSSEKFTFNYKGKSIQGYKWGRGPQNILFIHGWKSHTFQWKNYIRSLPEDKFSIYAIDAPGHGLSEGRLLNVPYYSEVIFQLIEKIGKIETLVSHSLGSFSIMHLLYNDPSLPVNKLVMMAPPGNAIDFIHFFQSTLNLSNRTVKLALDYFEKEIKKPIDFFSTTRFASNLSVPGIIIHDKDDQETPFKNAILINQVWKNSQLIATQGLNHNLKSPEVVKIVTNYIMENNLVLEGNEKFALIKS